MDNKAVPQAPKESWRIPDWFKDLKEGELVQLKKFHDELIKFNGALSLVSAKTLPFADAIHFTDCINASRLIYNNSKPKAILDIGSGNGFPGIVFAILFPQTQVTILDRDPKKLDFLVQTAAALGLKNLKVSAQSLDALPDSSIDCAVSRGFAPIGKAILALRKPFKRGGVYYMLKGEEWATEVSNIPSQLCTFWSPELVGDYKLPVGEVKFAVVRLNKIND